MIAPERPSVAYSDQPAVKADATPERERPDAAAEADFRAWREHRALHGNDDGYWPDGGAA